MGLWDWDGLPPVRGTLFEKNSTDVCICIYIYLYMYTGINKCCVFLIFQGAHLGKSLICGLDPVFVTVGLMG